jgi:hypothetical protein
MLKAGMPEWLAAAASRACVWGGGHLRGALTTSNASTRRHTDRQTKTHPPSTPGGLAATPSPAYVSGQPSRYLPPA